MRSIVASFLPLVLALGVLAEAPPKIQVGDQAPDFTMVDQNGQAHSLSQYKGKKNVVLAFYVFAFTPG
jgi:cytochrome oxidase Cu insertion factor (SCO1/SenC/PrrC family)